ncbi:MAG TPA: beta-propeller fold lactonase family protein [Gemmatimonadaceae bacterium]|jgi:6-phosphogluconolactonase (cycloisomerase 2 family)|nr:beta-propeller fold lactonase family protein [Gemmatimonadaceae bacterium]
MNTSRDIPPIPTAPSWTSILMVALTVAACSDGATEPESPAASRSVAASISRGDASNRSGAVYTLTNAVSGNGVIAFHRSPDGSLTPIATFPTGGLGTGGGVDPLESQYAVVLNERHDALFAVDAGSDQLSSFRVGSDGALALAGTVSSGGERPVSIAVHGNLLYALNAGDNTVSGFRVTGGARLVALPGSARSLATGANGAAAIRFTPDGRYVVVTERLSNRLEVLPVRHDGRLGEPVVTAANGSASFGFDITTRNQPIVSETQGSLTSYALANDGALSPITASISTGGTAACWVTITSDGRFAYTTNAGSNTVAGFSVDAGGHLAALTPSAPTGDAGAGASPIDLDHAGTRFLYALEAGSGTIATFMIDSDGTLTPRPDTPAGAPSSGLQGIAVF